MKLEVYGWMTAMAVYTWANYLFGWWNVQLVAISLLVCV